jgi:hypothetical protein
VRGAAYHPTYPLFASCADDGTAQVFHGMVRGWFEGFEGFFRVKKRLLALENPENRSLPAVACAQRACM